MAVDPSTVAVFVKRPYMIRMINKFNSLNRIVNQIHQVIKENFNESTVILTRETAGNKVNDILKEKLMETLDSNARQEDLPVDPKKMKAIVKTKVIDLWQDWWRSFDNTRDRTGLHTRRYIPSIHERLKWKYFEPSFVLTQYITNHGRFGDYLSSFVKVRARKVCPYCETNRIFNTVDTPEHRLLECEGTATLRQGNDWFITNGAINWSAILNTKDKYKKFLDLINQMNSPSLRRSLVTGKTSQF